MTLKDHYILLIIKRIAKKKMKGICDPVHDWEHVKAVVKYCKMLFKYYPKADKFVVLAGAYLHDTGIIDVAKTDHAKIGAENAKKILHRIGLSSSRIVAIKNVIATHSLHEHPTDIEGNIIRDADHIDWANFKRMKRLEKKFRNRPKEIKEIMKLWLDLEDSFKLNEAKEIYIARMKEMKNKLEKRYPEFKNKNYV